MAEIAFLDGTDFDLVGANAIASATFVTEPADNPIDPDDTIMLYTCEGNYFKIGHAACNAGDPATYQDCQDAGLPVGNVAFDYQQFGGIDLDGGPVYEPPGAGVETFSGDAAIAGGATIDYTGIDLTQTTNLYFGIRSDLFLNGFPMDGSGITGAEIFRLSSTTANSITYMGTTTFVTDFPNAGTWTTPTRFTVTFSGTGSVVSDTTTQSLNGPNGDVGALWLVQSSDFSVSLSIEAVAPPFDPNAGNYEPGNDLFNRIPSSFTTGSSFDWAFYFDLDSDDDGVADTTDNCIEIANADQRDTDGDGIGNRCDPDVALANDCVVNFLDLNVYRANFFQAGDLDTDNDGDGQTNFLDLNVIRDFFFGAPGPSANGCN